ncbi:hypothetical protein MCQ_00486 [Candidatus Bartonella washoeensis Sb944nv]|uniref:Uncharacterized protein n=1 Tax=Candidatus Bartonella washoeensis Sb944nv TaxID=1094563 RepID=J0Q6G3_9HYPH|nr:hypothetical protein MCQ_00486 [Bartonella washoeensis Sb944nv]
MDKKRTINKKILELWNKLTEEEKRQFILFYLDKMKKGDQEV